MLNVIPAPMIVAQAAVKNLAVDFFIVLPRYFAFFITIYVRFRQFYNNSGCREHFR